MTKPASRNLGSKAGIARKYSNRTLKLLWGRAAGHCSMAECRIELFADATDYDPVVVIGEIAHVKAASDGGPRAHATLSAAERDDYDNLILLCQNCHGRIDGQPGSYTVERLRDIKQAHEAWVRASLPERGRSTTGWTVLTLEGDHPLDLTIAHAALSPDFVLGEPRRLQVPGNTDDWPAVNAKIAATVGDVLSGPDVFDRRLAVMPLAPVSACLALGYHLTSRPHVRLFQNDRDTHSWAWSCKERLVNDLTVDGIDETQTNAHALAFLFHLSAEITADALDGALPDGTASINIRVPQPSTSWLRDPEQLNWVALAARNAFERAITTFSRAKEWHIFFAGPAPAGVAIGRQLNPTIYPPTQLYEYRRNLAPRYRPSIRLT